MMKEDKRTEIMEYIGYEYSEKGIKQMQKDYMARKSDVDGVWGPDTENLALTIYNVKKYTKNFEVKDFRCECNGRFCCGYPAHMTANELRHIQKIRDHYGKPMTITCGLRCPAQNRKVGGINMSRHKTGQAVDFYMAGVSDTLSNRRKSIDYIETLPNHNFTYGHGIDSDGRWYEAPGMGNALHTDTDGDDTPNPKPKPKPEPGKIVIDGIGGLDTVKRAQKVFGTAIDGTISGQNSACAKYYPSIRAVTFGGGGSVLVKAIQRWAGCDADGIWGEDTSKAIQKKLGIEATGIFDKTSMKTFQKFLNETEKVKPPKEDPRYKGQVIDVSYVQRSIDWNKVKADGIVGAIIRCGFRGYEKGTLQEDNMFMKHIKAAHKAGLKIGVYFFTEAINAREGKEEAAYTLNLIQKAGIPIDYPIAVDTEYIKAPGVRANNISVKTRTAAIKAFCEEIEKHGYKAMIYASLSWFDKELDMSQLPYSIWCAQHYSKCQYKGKYLFWQYTSEGKVNGIKGVVDMNKCYI